MHAHYPRNWYIYIYIYIDIYIYNNTICSKQKFDTSILVLCTHPLAWYLISLQFQVVLGWGHWPTNRMDKKQSTASTSASLVENTPVEFDSLELHRVGWIMWTPNLNNHHDLCWNFECHNFKRWIDMRSNKSVSLHPHGGTTSTPIQFTIKTLCKS